MAKDEDDGFAEALAGSIQKHPMRVLGASLVAAGTYDLVHLMLTMGHNLQQGILQIFGAGQPRAPDTLSGFFFQFFSGQEVSSNPFKGFDQWAFAMAISAGGMVMAGLNPGEVIKGIGALIEGIIPF